MEETQISELKIPDDLLVLSCEEDHAICTPFLDKGIVLELPSFISSKRRLWVCKNKMSLNLFAGAAVYSSELLLNGIVIQKLEYERLDCFISIYI